MNSGFSEKLRRFYWLLKTQVGIDPIKTLRCMAAFPRYLRDWYSFRRMCQERIRIVPCLHDWNDECGVTKSEYFWQDLLVARLIHKSNPNRHVDVGSRVDGFVAHVASFREIEVFDIRPTTAQIPGVVFTRADLMNSREVKENYCDSLSCLHALEHFGLGRYGDPINSEGFALGFANLVSLLENNGVFYLSVPIGIDRVEFNANRVIDPRAVVKLARENSLRCSSLVVIREGRRTDVVVSDEKELSELASLRYSLGIFTFTKTCDPVD